MKELSQPSQSFLEAFVREYNKGNVIKEVMVEYEQTGELESLPPIPIFELKVNPKDNTITIKRMKENWNRQELKEILREAWGAGYSSALNNASSIKGLKFSEWIEQNL